MQETLALYFTLERKFAPDAVQGSYASVLSVSTVTTEKGKSLSFPHIYDSCCFPPSTAMGVKMLQCFPFYRRCKERCKSRQCPPAAGEQQLHSYYSKKLPKQPFHNGVTTECLTLSLPIIWPSVPIEEMKPRLCSTTSWPSDSEGSLSRNSQIYFSTKARLSFRHQLDSNLNAVDATN